MTLHTGSKIAPRARQGAAQWSGRQSMAWALVLAGFLLVVYLVYFWTERIAIGKLQAGGAQRLEVYVSSLENALEKYDFLPKTLELNKDVIRLLQTPKDPDLLASVNQYLEQMNVQAKSTAIYITDLNGYTHAASNWRAKDSFVGDNVAFRPYARDALRGTPGRFYGVGTTKLEPGYFFAHGIYHQGKMLGLATVKVNIESLETRWVQGADKVMLADEHGVIFLTSVPAWKYKTLAPLAPAVGALLARTRQYYSHRLEPIPFLSDRLLGNGARVISVRDQALRGAVIKTSSSVMTQLRLRSPRNWQFIYLSDLAQARSSAQAAAAFSAVVLGFFLLLFFYLRQRRQALAQKLRAREQLQYAYDNLETMVAERTSELNAMTRSLSQEIAVRSQAEHKLHLTQNELFQAGKMAVLGQMSASITHELNQPLTALRTMSDNAVILLERGRLDDAKKNLATISQIAARMGAITGQLKVFARKSTTSLTSVSIPTAIGNALFLVERRLQVENVRFVQNLPGDDAFALCESNRLEQVLVNLFTNALDSMAGCAVRALTVDVLREGDKILVCVGDSGPGLSDEVRERLFEPFFTTKPQGVGLGLGLAISEQITRQFGGVLRADNAAGGGARFIIELNIAPQEEKHV
ncbi:two-component system, NtrC family, C4-dicarboxylate transport sensor histidine kinase DctB [Janthinobacterium sp. CG_23.3]|uniref:sensor histidine kinase n=1 Tax=unclassified Janthinobacterium TaxID=2610881 RepID=UPI0012FA183D|nr:MULTISPECIES: ATP-binding protein [unclassified Janthinobacterium]MEC5162895.1 two-component system C4-dicarboxylate transport sensor histidine kinase DctB [Janthinobacterium sp. CG_S6]